MNGGGTYRFVCYTETSANDVTPEATRLFASIAGLALRFIHNQPPPTKPELSTDFPSNPEEVLIHIS